METKVQFAKSSEPLNVLLIGNNPIDLTKTLEKILIVPTPRAGLWRVVIDAGAPGTAFDYTEIITNDAFGSGTAVAALIQMSV